MVKQDGLDKAPSNDAALSRQQKLYTGCKFTSYKVHLLSCPWAQNLPGDILVGADFLSNKAAVGNCLLYTFQLLIFFYIEM